MVRSERPIPDLLQKISACIDDGKFTMTLHAIARQDERAINLPKILYVLKRLMKRLG